MRQADRDAAALLAIAGHVCDRDAETLRAIAYRMIGRVDAPRKSRRSVMDSFQLNGRTVMIVQQKRAGFGISF